MTEIPTKYSDEIYFLNAVEHKKLATYSLKKRRREWLAGRLCLKYSASTYFGENINKEVELQKYLVYNRDDGRPVLQGHDEDISISHSKDFAFAMISKKTCGIDIQQAVPTLEKVEDRYCSEVEAQILEQLIQHPKLYQLAMLWACKEALQKAVTRYEKMPGFLELLLVNIRMQEGLCLFSLSYSTQEKMRVFTVPVTCYKNYAVAYVILEEN